MKTRYGLQADAWGALVMDRAGLADELEKRVIHGMQERGIEGLEVSKDQMTLDGALGGETRKHVIFQQKLGRGGRVAVALRIAQRGTQDLELSWRLFEKNVGTDVAWGVGQVVLVILGGFTVLVGLGLTIFGYGLCIIPMGVALMGLGLGWWRKGKGKTTASTYEQFDSRALVQSMDYVLMKALSTCGVGAHEIRILRRADMSGLGVLQKTSAMEEMSS